MKRIGIITFHRADNYGAVLQNYALQRMIVKLGYEVKTIDYSCVEIEDTYRIWQKIVAKNITELIKQVIRNILNLQPTFANRKKFRAFRRNYLKLTRGYNLKNIESSCDEFDIVLCGSDQIWNEMYMGKNIDVYTLRFVKNKTKVAYGASAGLGKIWNGHIIESIKEFDYVTVREIALSKFLDREKISNSVVCDPVFLLTSQEWEKIISSIKPRKKSYLFLYFLDSKKKETCEIADYIARKKGWKVCCPCKYCKQSVRFGKNAFDDGPLEFVSDIKNAELIIASSFHAIAFAIILKKDFFVVLHETTGQRVRDLLYFLGLEDRIISDLDDYKGGDWDNKHINYESVEKRMTKWRENSLEHLRKMCSL